MKMIIIDDRPIRQKSMLGEEGFKSLSTCQNLDMSLTLLEEDQLNMYSVIAAHRSLLTEKRIYSEIIDFCTANAKALIMFSGGTPTLSQISQSIIDISATQFYNIETLFPFIHELESAVTMPEILRVVYGEQWMISYLLKYQYIVWRYGDNMPNTNGNDVGDQFYELTRKISSVYNRAEIDIDFVKNQISSILKQF